MLAGGASRRFGADKALLTLCPGAQTLIERVVHVATNVAAEVFIVGHDRYSAVVPNVPIFADNPSGQGPLSGIRTALQMSSSPRVLVLACDQPCLSVPLLRWMASLRVSADILAPRTDDGRLHPMPAIYRKAVLPAVETCLQRDQRSIAALLDAVSTQEIAESDLRQFDHDLRSLFSLNSPDQLEAAIDCADCN